MPKSTAEIKDFLARAGQSRGGKLLAERLEGNDAMLDIVSNFLNVFDIALSANAENSNALKANMEFSAEKMGGVLDRVGNIVNQNGDAITAIGSMAEAIQRNNALLEEVLAELRKPVVKEVHATRGADGKIDPKSIKVTEKRDG